MECSSLLLSIFLSAIILAVISLYIFSTLPFILTLFQVLSNRHRTVDWAAELLAASPTPTVTVAPVVFTADPSNVEHISKSHFGGHPRTSFIVSAFHDFLGDGILNSDGEPWRLQRKAASYEFSTGSLRFLVLDRVSLSIQQRLLPFLESASEKLRVFDLQEVFERFAFDNVSSVALGYDPDCLNGRDEKGLYKAFHEVVDASLDRVKLSVSLIWRLKKLLNVGCERRLRDSMAAINEFLDQSFTQSRITNKRDSFLSKLVNDGKHSDKFVRELLLSLMLAGRDTTPSALTWFFWLVSSRGDVIRKIREEVRSIRARSETKALTLDSLRQMNYLQAAFSESMRLVPPVAIVGRECQEAETLPDGTEVKKGWAVMYSQLAMGRSKAIWGEDCEEFRPERWLVDGAFRARSPFEYPVFHAGPGVCLGKELAMVQMKAVAASVLERFEVEVAGERGEHESLITLRMKGGLPVRVREIYPSS